jgi:hypothetical protein
MPWRPIEVDREHADATPRLFPRQARFYSDENVDTRIAQRLANSESTF